MINLSLLNICFVLHVKLPDICTIVTIVSNYSAALSLYGIGSSILSKLREDFVSNYSR